MASYDPTARRFASSNTRNPSSRVNVRAASAPAGSITSRWLFDGIERAKSLQDANFHRLVYDKQDMQTQKEEAMIATKETCVFDRKSELAYKLSQIDGQKLKDMVDNTFYNPELMSAVMCLSDVVYHGNDQSYMNERVRNWLTKLRQIGAESIAGIALRANFDDASQLFIVKAPRTETSSGLVHELFVGLYGTNALRQRVPNFAYIYGGFKCTAPLVDNKNKEVVTWCNRKNAGSVNYVLYENIAPGVDMANYIKDCSQLDFFNKYLQALYSLHVANETIDFTHYDAHAENAIVRQVSKFNDFYIPYTTENGTEYMKTNGVLTWIDFGTAHIKVNNQGYGDYTRSTHGVDARDKFPLYDAFKLLGFCMYYMMNTGRRDLFGQAARILRYFTKENPSTFIKEQRETYYSLPRVPELVNRSLLDLTNYIRQWIPEVNRFMFSQPPRDGKIMGCATGQCQSLDTIIDQLGMSSTAPHAENMVEAADIIRQIPSNDERGRQAVRNALNQNYTSLLAAGKKQFRQYVNDIQLSIPKRRLTLNGAAAEAIFTKEMLQSYRDYVLTVGRLIDLIQRARTLLSAVAIVQRFLAVDTTDFGTELGQVYTQFVEYHQKMDTIIEDLKTDYDYLVKIAGSDANAAANLGEASPYFWYQSGIRTIIYATSA